MHYTTVTIVFGSLQELFFECMFESTEYVSFLDEGTSSYNLFQISSRLECKHFAMQISVLEKGRGWNVPIAQAHGLGIDDTCTLSNDYIIASC